MMDLESLGGREEEGGKREGRRGGKEEGGKERREGGEGGKERGREDYPHQLSPPHR